MGQFRTLVLSLIKLVNRAVQDRVVRSQILKSADMSSPVILPILYTKYRLNGFIGAVSVMAACLWRSDSVIFAAKPP